MWANRSGLFAKSKGKAVSTLCKQIYIWGKEYSRMHLLIALATKEPMWFKENIEGLSAIASKLIDFFIEGRMVRGGGGDKRHECVLFIQVLADAQ